MELIPSFKLNIKILIDKPYFVNSVQSNFIQYISKQKYDNITVKWILEDNPSISYNYYTYSNQSYEEVYEQTEKILKKGFFYMRNIYPEFGYNWEYKFTIEKV